MLVFVHLALISRPRFRPIQTQDKLLFQLTIWSAPPIAAAAIAMAAFLRARKRSKAPGGTALGFLFLMLFFWSAAQGISTLVTSPAAIMLAAQFAYVGIALTPVAWFLFALTYSQRVLRISRHALNTVSIIPMITLTLALTNPWHGLIWKDWEFINTNGFIGFTTQHGFWFYVHAVYSYGLILTATAILGFALTQFKQHYQTLLAVIFAPLVAVVANLLFLSPLNPYPWLDFTTMGFVLGVVILDMGVMREGLLNSVPVVRDAVVEQLKDPVLVIDHSGQIIDANQSALAAWGGSQSMRNTRVDQLISSIPTTSILSSRKNSEVTIDGRAYEIASTHLDATNAQSNVALVFRDVSERRAAEYALKEAKEELERMAHTDALTNMFNRRFFMQRLGEEYERVRRHGSMLSVLIFDLDHFKQINDNHGHDAGDAVLIGVSAAVNEVKRVTDIACRLGGEEFALLLPETARPGAIHLAQRLRRSIRDYPYQVYTEETLKVTASVGVATVSAGATPPESLLKVADRALYKAKASGRDRVCVEEDLS